MSEAQQRKIVKVFRKYGHSLGPDVLRFVEQICEDHEIAEADIESSVEHLAKEYNKQDDAVMKVSLRILQRVYDTMQGTADAADDLLDADSHLHFIQSTDMPLWNWSLERGTFERASSGSSVAASPDSRVNSIRNRFHAIRQVVLRNDHFSASSVPGHDRERLLTIKSTKQLLGRSGSRFLLFGLLAHSEDGRLSLEDLDGRVVLDLSRMDNPSEGLFTEGCIALVEGDYTDDETIRVIAMGHPPCERRETARSIYGHIDFLGSGSMTYLEESQLIQRMQLELSDIKFFVLSDLWLDHPQTLPGLRKLFENCIETNYIPHVFVLCGNFTSKGVSQANGQQLARYQEGFDSLADLIASYPLLSRRCHFLFVPGPLDICSSAILPRRPLTAPLTSRLKSKVLKAHFGSNPCRISFFGQEIVVFRDDLMSRMLRNTIGVKQTSGIDGETLKRFLVQSIVDQCHLSPFTAQTQPTLPEYEHSLRLYPMPSAMILADKYDKYDLTYEGCHVFNPGSFIGLSRYFSVYHPPAGRSEPSEIEYEN